MTQEKEKHAAHVRQLSNEMENLKELLHTYEISIGRKDEVVIQFHNSTVLIFRPSKYKCCNTTGMGLV